VIMTSVIDVQMMFSVELTPQLLCHQLDFMSTTHLSDDPLVIDNAVRRYERCWLPLAAEVARSELSLCPPVDVHWIWHCHMLAPRHYERDCLQLVGKVVGHRVRLAEQLAERRLATADVWRQKYPQEPFDVTDASPSAAAGPYQRLSSYDLSAAVRRQSKFFYNVSLPHYRDDVFLQQAVARYRKFLLLKLRHRDALLVPTYDIDLVWHTHQLHPLVYKHDTARLMGRMLNHDDNLNDRDPDSPLLSAYVRTKQLWRQAYREHYALTGAMYRGERPHGRLADDTGLAGNDRKKTVLRLATDAFQSCVMPEDVEQLWGPVPLPKLPEGTDNKCFAASHR